MDNKCIKGVYLPEKESVKDIYIEDGLISEIKDSDYESGKIAIPGFIDTHIHGFAGSGAESGKEDEILNMSTELIKYGVTSFFPTLYTDTVENMDKALIAINSAKGKEKGAEIKGIHIEGPFISEKRIGAQNPDGRKDVSIELFNHFLSLAPGLVKAMTTAPELKNSDRLAAEAKKNNVVLLAGHTDATFEETKRGFFSGIRHATHLFNAMKGLHHREPGTVGAILSLDDMTCEIIADGLHVNPEVFKLVVKIKGDDNVVAVTDSLKPTGQKEGPFLANGVPVVLKDDLWVTKGREDLIQGSSLNMHKAFKNLVSWGISLKSAIKLTSTNACRIYSLDCLGEIEVGKKADILILNKNLDILEVYKCGTTI